MFSSMFLATGHPVTVVRRRLFYCRVTCLLIVSRLQEGHAFVCSILNRVEAHEVAELPSVELHSVVFFES